MKVQVFGGVNHGKVPTWMMREDIKVSDAARVLYAKLTITDVTSSAKLGKELKWTPGKVAKAYDELVALGAIVLDPVTERCELTGDRNDPPPAGPVAPPVKMDGDPAAQRLTEAFFAGTPRPLIKFPVVKRRVADALKSGWSERVVANAMAVTNNWTVGAFEEALQASRLAERDDIPKLIAYWNRFKHPNQPEMPVVIPSTSPVYRDVAAFIDECPDGKVAAYAIKAFAHHTESNGSGRFPPMPLTGLISKYNRTRWIGEGIKLLAAAERESDLSAPPGRTQHVPSESEPERLHRELAEMESDMEKSSAPWPAMQAQIDRHKARIARLG